MHQRDTSKTHTVHKNGDKKSAFSLRDQFIKTNLDLFCLGSFVAYCNGWVATATFTAIDFENEPVENGVKDLTIEPTYAILYPWFAQTLAIFIYYILSRYLQFLPYAAIVFLLGVALGYFTTPDPDDAIGQSALLWLNINGQVILLVFLPGLIFLDSFDINVHLFFQVFWQLIVFACPMVLGGTCLTALVAKYVFPYNWPFDLCMTFGAILSSTDPIAVAGLLDALGAPPRLKMHISGESLLNDGAAVVFYSIFSNRFFFDLGIPDFGEDIGWDKGFVSFFRMVFGGAAVGLAFGLGTVLLLKLLHRRLLVEENVIQVVALISLAYLTYFVAEILSDCSGIIATIACGLTVKVLGESDINDINLVLHFFEVTAQLLNTLLFVLGGTVWGNSISVSDALGDYHQTFSGIDWGYLAILFIMLIAIRFVLVFAFYPITANIGIGSNVREAVFMAYGGFRGSVGIALALSMYARIMEATEEDPHEYHKYRSDVGRMFFMSGGISLGTLLVIGVTCKPLIQMLGLATPEKTRLKVIANFRKQMTQQALASYVRLLSQERFKGINFSLIKLHVPFLRDITFEQIMAAVEWHKNNTPQYLYSKPRLEHVVPYLYRPSAGEEEPKFAESSIGFERLGRVLTNRRASIMKMKEHHKWDDVFGSFDSSKSSIVSTLDSEAVSEARLNFIEILRSAYHHQIKVSELESDGELHYSLFQSLDFCEDAAAKSLPLNDWEATKVASATKVVLVDQCFTVFCLRLKQMRRNRKISCSFGFDVDRFGIWMIVRQSMAFVRAHRRAQREFKEHFASSPPTPAENQVLDESSSQIMAAEADLSDIDPIDIERIKGNFLCSILLTEGAQYVETLSNQGLMPEKEAGEMLEELDVFIENVTLCDDFGHEGRLSLAVQTTRLRQLPSTVLNELDLWEAIEEMSERAGSESLSDLPSETDDSLSTSLLG